MMLLSDPVFWFAMFGWLGILLLVLGMFVVAARADRLAERARADIESRRRDEFVNGWEGTE